MRTEPVTQALSTPPGQALIDLRGVSVVYSGQRLLRTGRAEPGPRPHRPRLPGSQRASRPASSIALSEVDLAIRHGELVTLAGPAGSGKSTLLSVIGLLLWPTTGSYLLNGIDTAALGDRERTAFRGRQFGCVFQHRHLLPARSAMENVMLPVLYSGLPRQRREIAAADALDRVGLARRMHTAACELSAAEQQRVAIARAIVASPSLLLCDDPTASLDGEGAAQIIGLLVSLHREGRTVLIATRDQLAAAYSSRSVTVGAKDAAAGTSTGP